MFEQCRAFSGFAVDDLAAAKRFYQDTLGMPATSHMGGRILDVALPGGDSHVLVYPKPDFEPASDTILNFAVRDVDAAVDGLTAAGVEMARFAGFDQDERGIARGEGPSIAWFRDPAGNILSVVEDDTI